MHQPPGAAGSTSAASATGATARPSVAVAVLAGGGSRRMARDKAAVEVEGRPLLERTLAAAGAVASPRTDVTVIGTPSSGTSAALGRWTPDLRRDQGPLAGLETALAVAEGATAVLVVGVDHPWLAPAVLTALVDTLLAAPDRLDAVVLGTADGPQPLLGAYRPSARPQISALLDTGERRLRTLLDRLQVEVMTPDRWRHLDPLGATTVDVDDPDTLAAAIRWHARASATLSDSDRSDAPRTPAGARERLADGGPGAAPGAPRGREAVNPDRLGTPHAPGKHDRGREAVNPDRLGTPGRQVLHVRAHGPASATPTSPTGATATGARATPTARAASETDSIEVVARVDVLLGEQPLEIRAAGPDQEPVTLATTLRSPGHEAELAVGWILAQGLATAADVIGTTAGDPSADGRPEDTVTVLLRHDVDPNALVHRHVLATASCGVCGRATLEELATWVPPVDDGVFRSQPLRWAGLARLPEELRLAQGRTHTTGGVHAAGLFDAEGRLVTLRQDIGRHNALDSAIGAHAVAGIWPEDGLNDLVCVLTSRVGFELVAKAAVARIPVVASVGAASDLAARTAERFGITLVGGLRDGAGVVYSHAERLLLTDPH